MDNQRSKGQNETRSIRLYILWSNNKQIVCTHLRISVEVFDKHVWYLINVNNLIIFDDIGLLYNDMFVCFFLHLEYLLLHVFKRLLNKFRHQNCELHDAYPKMCQQFCSCKKVQSITNKLYIFDHFLSMHVKKYH